MLTLCILHLLYQRKNMLEKTKIHWIVRLLSRIFSGIIVSLLPLFPSEQLPIWAVSLTIAGIMMFLVLFEHFGSYHSTERLDSQVDVSYTNLVGVREDIWR